MLNINRTLTILSTKKTISQKLRHIIYTFPGTNPYIYGGNCIGGVVKLFVQALVHRMFAFGETYCAKLSYLKY